MLPVLLACLACDRLTGSAEVALSFQSAVVVRAEYTVTGQGIATPLTGQWDLPNGGAQPVNVTVGNIPAGRDRTLLVRALDANGDERCRGSVEFDQRIGVREALRLPLHCDPDPPSPASCPGGISSYRLQGTADYFNLDTRTSERYADVTTPKDGGWDVTVGYNEAASLQSVIVQNASGGVTLAHLPGRTFDNVTSADVPIATFTPNLIDIPFGDDRVILVRTDRGTVFKLGNSSGGVSDRSSFVFEAAALTGGCSPAFVRNLVPAATGSISDFPELGLRQVDLPEATSNLFRTTEENRQWTRGFLEFSVPTFDDRFIESAVLVLVETRGHSPDAPPHPGRHLLMSYRADLKVTLDDWDAGAVHLTQFETSTRERPAVWKFDLTTAVREYRGRPLGLRMQPDLPPTHFEPDFQGTSFSDWWFEIQVR